MKTVELQNEKKIVGILQDFADRHPNPEWSTTILLGSTGREQAKWLAKLGFGEMWAEKPVPEPYPDQPWALDNGAWAMWDELDGVDPVMTPEDFPEDTFKTRLKNAYHLPPSDPLFAVVPDLVGAGMQSLEFSLEWMDRIEGWGYGDLDWYLGLQGGMTIEAVIEVLPRFDGVLFGGGDRFKGTAPHWIELTREAGLPFHYAQCGTYGKMVDAYNLGADSIDSAGPLKPGGNLVPFLRTCEKLFAGDSDGVS